MKAVNSLVKTINRPPMFMERKTYTSAIVVLAKGIHAANWLVFVNIVVETITKMDTKIASVAEKVSNENSMEPRSIRTGREGYL